MNRYHELKEQHKKTRGTELSSVYVLLDRPAAFVLREVTKPEPTRHRVARLLADSRAIVTPYKEDPRLLPADIDAATTESCMLYVLTEHPNHVGEALEGLIGLGVRDVSHTNWAPFMTSKPSNHAPA